MSGGDHHHAGASLVIDGEGAQRAEAGEAEGLCDHGERRLSRGLQHLGVGQARRAELTPTSKGRGVKAMHSACSNGRPHGATS